MSHEQWTFLVVPMELVSAELATEIRRRKRIGTSEHPKADQARDRSVKRIERLLSSLCHDVHGIICVEYVWPNKTVVALVLFPAHVSKQDIWKRACTFVPNIASSVGRVTNHQWYKGYCWYSPDGDTSQQKRLW
jgi:hypothetical protein